MPEGIPQQVTSYLPASSYYYVIPSWFANTCSNYNKPKWPKDLRINPKIKDLNFAFNKYEIRWISGIRKYFFLLYRMSSKLKTNFPTCLHKITTCPICLAVKKGHAELTKNLWVFHIAYFTCSLLVYIFFKVAATLYHNEDEVPISREKLRKWYFARAKKRSRKLYNYIPADITLLALQCTFHNFCVWPETCKISPTPPF